MKNLTQVYDNQIVSLNKRLEAFQNSLGDFAKVAVEIPEITRIGNLAPSESEFGIDLIGGGSFDQFEKSVPEAIDSMIEAIGKQGQAINQKINDEGQTEVQRVQKLIKEFEEIKSSCTAVYQKMQSDIAKVQEEEQELFKKADALCKKGVAMFSGGQPPGCDELGSLAKEAYELAHVVSSDVIGAANGWLIIVEQIEQADSPEGDSPIGNLARACSRGDNDGAKQELLDLKKKLLGEATYADRAKPIQPSRALPKDELLKLLKQHQKN